MKRVSAFTLVEVLIVVIILGILAAAIVPAFTAASDDARAATTATLVKSLSRLCETIKLKTGSYPKTIDATMFEGGELPRNPFDPDNTLGFQIVNTAGAMHPPTKVVSTTSAYAAFWYNRSNGIVRARVSRGANNAETIDTYNAANGTHITDLAQTN